MTFWAVAALFNSLVSALLGTLVFLKDKKNEKNVLYGLFCMSLCLWSAAYFLWQKGNNQIGHDREHWFQAITDLRNLTFVG